MIKYFTDIKGNKFIVERITETGFVVHKRGGLDEEIGKSFEFSFNDVIADFKVENLKFNAEAKIEDMDGLLNFIKTWKRDAKIARLEAEDLERAKEKERLEQEKIENEKRRLKDIEDRKRKAKAIKARLELENED